MERLYYEKKLTVLMRDCDMFRRLKPSAMLSMFQDCSEDLTEGWGVGLDAMMEKGIIWVAAKVTCTVHRLPEHCDEITVRGWAGRTRGSICPFHYEMWSAEGELLVTGCSMWVLSDLETHSMMSPNVPSLDLPTPDAPNTRLPRMGAILPPAEFETTTRKVQFSEVDINGHLTNTRYVDWMCDLPTREFHQTHPMTGIRLNYRAETFPDEEIALDWRCDDDRLWCRSAGRFEAQISF